VASPGFPERPRRALERLEFLVAPANRGRFDVEMERRVPSVRFPREAPQVDRALELWFCDRDAVIELVLALENGANGKPRTHTDLTTDAADERGSELQTAKYAKDAKGETEPEMRMFNHESHESTRMGNLTEGNGDNGGGIPTTDGRYEHGSLECRIQNSDCKMGEAGARCGDRALPCWRETTGLRTLVSNACV